MGFIKSHKRALLALLAVLILLGAGSLYWLRTSDAPLAAGFRATVKDILSDTGYGRRPNLTKELHVLGETVYVDGAPGTMPKNPERHDVKVSYLTPDGQVFCDYTTGFAVTLPVDMAADISLSPALVSFESPEAQVVISREWAVGEAPDAYVAYYFYRFLLDASYREKNGIELIEHTKTDALERLTVRLLDYPGVFDTYTYLTFKTGTQNFFHAMVKYSSLSQAASSLPRQVADSFIYFRPEGTAVYTADFYPQLPENWTAETRAVYDKLAFSDTMLWGIFTKDVLTEGIEREIPDMEARLDYQFDIILTYTGLDGGFPSAFMERCYNEGRLVELTLHATESTNMDLFGRSPWLELYKKGDDPRIRAFARAAKEFGKPFLFRLNNEMNSDWVSYAGVNNLLDPGIFRENWRTIYRIFEEEGVNNAIWIFNPHDRTYPPNSWNVPAAYYPGNGYVHLFGVTGYNNGTYYQTVWNEQWREFDDIYSQIQKEYAGLFGAFPWIVTEFASSSVGGDKVKWIDNMFSNLHKYPNIKAAVWYSAADYDPKDWTTVARPYWLNETDETLEAFRRGLKGLK